MGCVVAWSGEWLAACRGLGDATSGGLSCTLADVCHEQLCLVGHGPWWIAWWELGGAGGIVWDGVGALWAMACLCGCP
eukprot:8705604-Alexandrium_andersonii.AAC.1